MKDLIIVGAGGFAREVALLVDQINEVRQAWTLLGFYDVHATTPSKLRDLPVLGPAQLDSLPRSTMFALGIGSPAVKRRAVKDMRQRGYSRGATLVHPSVQLDASVTIETGAIVCAGTILTVDIMVKQFATVNLGCTIGHDSSLGEYVQLSPGCNVSGRVIVEAGVFMGTNASTVEEVTIGMWSKIGAGAVVLSNIPPYSTAVGVPARAVHRDVGDIVE